MAEHRSDATPGTTSGSGAPTTTTERTTTTAAGSARSTGVSERGATSYRDDLNDTAGAPVGRQRFNWGPVWAGFVVALATYLMLELLLFATGAREVNVDADVNEAAFITAIIALVAFFIGGLTAGATMRWTHPAEGAVHGLLVWALTVVAFLVLSVFGAGLALGGIGTAAEQLGLDLEQVAQDAQEDIDAQQATDDAREAAGWAVGALALTLAAAAGGGALGSRIGAERRAARVDLRERPGQYAGKVD